MHIGSGLHEVTVATGETQTAFSWARVWSRNSKFKISDRHSCGEAWWAGSYFNACKSKCLTIKKTKNCPQPTIPDIPAVETLRILGFTFNSKWNTDDHISKTVSFVSRRLYALRILKPSLTKAEMLLVYNSLVRSHLEYCAPLLLRLSVANSCKLERLQKRFHRVICGKSCSQSCMILLKERRKILSMRFLEKVMVPSHVIHSLLPFKLKSGRFRLPFRRTTKRCLSFFRKCVKCTTLMCITESPLLDVLFLSWVMFF